MDKVYKAKSFIKGAYAAQGSALEPSGSICIEHPAAVARLVWQVTLDDTATAAALLHEVMTSTGISADTLVAEFGYDVAALVLEVTDVSRARDGSRGYRSALDRAHVAGASPTGQTIKVADLIDRTAVELGRCPESWRVPIEDMRTFLEVLPRADPTLLRSARRMIDAYAVSMAA